MQHFGDKLNQTLTDDARHTYATAGRVAQPQTPAERAFELIARLDIAKQHKDRAAFEQAKLELSTLIERL